jgi:3-hydroxyacyl-CoA dehydrogenase / enoyl-CoA hydratase / 3-hydroxybutyryl-CoA epimerase
MATQTERSGAFHFGVEGNVAIISFDSPDEPVNTISPPMIENLERLLKRVENDPAISSVVFASAKKDNFIAGADIEFFKTLTDANMAREVLTNAQKAFDRLDAFPKPLVAAINGACLGGGLEFALACDYRIATDGAKTSLGLPEVQLGVIPAAGGTQRLPRLVGVQVALDLILAGKTLKASKAKRIGLVDEVVPQPILLSIAVARAQELAEGKRQIDRGPKLKRAVTQQKGFGKLLQNLTQKDLWTGVALEENPVGRKVLFDQARKQLLKKTHGHYPAPLAALEAIRVGLDDGMAAGLAVEAQKFGELVVSPVSRRLIEIFFATTALKKENGVHDAKVKARPVRQVGVLGAGLMGSGIAYVTAQNASIPVRIKVRDDLAVGRGLKAVRGIYDERVRRRSMSPRDAEAKLAMVSPTTDYSGFKRADVVIEAVFEDLAIKHQVVREVEAVTGPETIFASNTSSLPIGKIAEASKRPETVIGMHYFSPVNKMPLLEIIVHKGTADWVTATAVELGRKQGKTVIVVNDGVGFYTSRILAPYVNEAAFLLAEGADITQLDAALVKFGFPVGPVALLDEVGIDVGAKVAKIMHEAFGDRMSPPDALSNVIKDGREGRKNGRGFYRYEAGKKTKGKKEVDESVYALLPHGKERKNLDAADMAERCVLQMVNEAVRCLGEEILRSPRDGDIGAIFGLGFPPFLGGPFRYIDAQGSRSVLERMEQWQAKLGKRFEPAPLLAEYGRQNKTFY